MRTPIRMAAVAASILAVSANISAHVHHDEVRHADAHVHGQGELNFAVEGSELHMELMMPAHDVLGFESITTKAQQQQLDEALHKLEAESLWSLSAQAECQLSSAHASTTGHDHGHSEHKSSHSHDDHVHDHAHAHGHAHDHDHDHMDIAVSYVFQCKNADNLTQLSTSLFETFPRSEMIRVQGFTASGQLSETMNSGQPQVRF